MWRAYEQNVLTDAFLFFFHFFIVSIFYVKCTVDFSLPKIWLKANFDHNFLNIIKLNILVIDNSQIKILLVF